MSTTTLDSGAFPALGIHASGRKTPAPWDNLMPGDSGLGVQRPRRSSTANLRVVRAEPSTSWASPPPLVTKQALMAFQLALAAMVMVSVFVL